MELAARASAAGSGADAGLDRTSAPGYDPNGWRSPHDLVDSTLWPQATVYVHMDPALFTRDAAGAVTLEGHGPITTAQAFDALGHHQVTIQPVIDLAGMPESQSDVFTGRLREAAVLKSPTTVFPYSDKPARSADIDHSKPRGPTNASERGPTRVENAGPLARREHRIRTHGRWQHAQPFNGIYTWLSPHGRLLVIDRKGHTHDLGHAA